MNHIKKTIVALSILLLTSSHALSMEPKKPKSCCAAPTDSVISSMNRAIFTYCLGKRRFTPSTTEDARSFFAKKNITIAQRLQTLETDAHLVAVAQRAGLKGIALFAAPLKSSIYYDTYTGTSVAEFKDGNISHAIAIPDHLCADEANQYPLICGIVEREIARISQAYTKDDIEIIKLKQNFGWTGYSLAALVGLLIEPYSLIATGAAGLVAESIVREGTEIAHELACDAKAAQLSETTDHLMATVMKSDSSFHLAQEDSQLAQDAMNGKIASCRLRLRALRIYELLKLKQELEKSE